MQYKMESAPRPYSPPRRRKRLSPLERNVFTRTDKVFPHVHYTRDTSLVNKCKLIFLVYMVYTSQRPLEK